MAKLDTKNSIVDYLKSTGQDSSYSARAKLAKSAGITNYSGSDTQNIQLLNTLKSGGTKSAKDDVKPVTPKADSGTGKVNNNAGTVDTPSTILGVDKGTQDRMNSTFNQSQESKDRDAKKEAGLSNLESLVGKDQIISDSVWSSLNSSFTVPSAVREADAYLAQQLEKIQSGKTSYSDDVRAMMDKIMNRDKFSYDVDTDPLFQQALASAMSSGKQAMQDTIGQASALTGGYGSSYATTAGNQAYNSFIEDAYDNLPQYYQMALEAYQMEGDEMYRQYAMLSAEDDKEYNRNVTAYDATYQHRNQIYNEAYTQFRDSKSDAFAMANLQLNEHGQLVSDAVNYYNAASNYADSLYEREYTKWADDVNIAYKYAEMLNSDYWSETKLDYQKDRDAVTDAQWEKQFAETKRVNDAQIAKMRSSGSSGSKSGNNSKKIADAIPNEIVTEAKKATTNEARLNYVADMVDKGYITDEQGNYLLDTYNQAALEDRVWKVESKGGLNWGGGVDKNAKIIDQYENTYRMDDLWDELSKTMGEDEAEKWIIQLQKDLGISWRN